MKPTITLAVADTDTHVLAKQAIDLSVREFRFSRVLVLTDRPEAFAGYDTVRIEPFTSMPQYCRFIAQQLPEHVTTDFVVTAQYDGFVIHGDQFSPHFHHYDYIGAPWPMWESLNVGNGGFSWRSRKFLEAVRALPYDGTQVEDVFVCRTMRVFLEDTAQIRFAGQEIASHFSQELLPKPWPSFGFHGIFHLPAIYRDHLDFLVDNLTPRVLRHPVSGPQLAKHIGAISAEALARFEDRRRAALAGR